MRDNRQYGDSSAHRSAIMLLVIALHVVVLYVFITATGLVVIPASLKVMQVKFVHVDPPKQMGPPPPATTTILEPPVIQIIPPEVRIQTAATPDPAPKLEQRAADPEQQIVADQPGGLIVPPVRISRPHKSEKYPGKSVKNRESGRTELRICVSASGTVDTADVTRSSGYPRLDEAAVEMAMDTQFKPASLLGKAVPYCMVTGIRFSLR